MSIQTTGVIPVLTFGQRLTVAMEWAGLKPEDLAIVLDCSAHTVRNYISGRTRIDGGKLTLWALATGVDRDWIDNGNAGPDGGPGMSYTARDLNPQPADYVSDLEELAVVVPLFAGAPEPVEEPDEEAA